MNILLLLEAHPSVEWQKAGKWAQNEGGCAATSLDAATSPEPVPAPSSLSVWRA